MFSRLMGSAPSAEEIAVQKRNALREVGKEYSKESAELGVRIEREIQVYQAAVAKLQQLGRRDGEYARIALTALTNRTELQKKKDTVDERIRTIDNLLSSATRRDTDAKYVTALQSMVTHEQKHQPINYQQVAKTMMETERMAVANEKMSECIQMGDMNTVVVNESALMQQLYADLAVPASPGAEATARLSSYTPPSEKAQAKAMEALLRSDPALASGY